jgi:hypothetical protein
MSKLTPNQIQKKQKIKIRAITQTQDTYISKVCSHNIFNSFLFNFSLFLIFQIFFKHFSSCEFHSCARITVSLFPFFSLTPKLSLSFFLSLSFLHCLFDFNLNFCFNLNVNKQRKRETQQQQQQQQNQTLI